MKNEIGRLEATEHENCPHDGCTGMEAAGHPTCPHGCTVSASNCFDRMEAAGHPDCPHGCPTCNNMGHEGCSGNGSGFDRMEA